MSPSACGEGGCPHPLSREGECPHPLAGRADVPIRFWHGALILCPTCHLFFMPPSLLLRLHAWAGQTVSELALDRG